MQDGPGHRPRAGPSRGAQAPVHERRERDPVDRERQQRAVALDRARRPGSRRASRRTRPRSRPRSRGPCRRARPCRTTPLPLQSGGARDHRQRGLQRQDARVRAREAARARDGERRAAARDAGEQRARLRETEAATRRARSRRIAAVRAHGVRRLPPSPRHPSRGRARSPPGCRAVARSCARRRARRAPAAACSARAGAPRRDRARGAPPRPPRAGRRAAPRACPRAARPRSACALVVQRRVRPAKQPRHERDVRRGRDRQQLRRPVQQPERDRVAGAQPAGVSARRHRRPARRTRPPRHRHRRHRGGSARRGTRSRRRSSPRPRSRRSAASPSSPSQLSPTCLADEHEHEDPRQAAEERQHAEAQNRHPRDAGRQRDERADDRQHAREEDRRVAVLLEVAVGGVQVRGLDVQLAAVLLEDVDAAVVADGVGDPRADEVGERTDERRGDERVLALGDVEARRTASSPRSGSGCRRSRAA